MFKINKFKQMKKNYSSKLTMAIFTMLIFITNAAFAQLYINEFMASNDAAYPGPQGDYPDWIEIYNAGSEDVMLGGYYLYDAIDLAEAYQIPDTYPDSVTVPAGGYIVFNANKEEASSVMNLNFKLSGDGEEIGFWDTDQNLIDHIIFGAQTDDISYGRYPDGSDDWGFMSDYTPWETNMAPDPITVSLFINEFMASNDFAFPGPQGDYPDWIEIYNAGTEDVNLGGYYLSDDLEEMKFMIPDTYPDSVTVPAGGFILFYANDDSAWSVLNTNFKLSGGGESVGLWDPTGNFIDSITYGEQIADTSYGRYENGTDNWYMMPNYTPGASNSNPNPPIETELYINEFMASNDFAFPGPQGDYPDWIEIYNAGTEDVDLSGYYLSDDLAEMKFMIPDTYPDSVTVAAGGFILFYANDDTEWSVLNTNFKLSGGGEMIGFWDPDGNFVDSLTYGEQIADTSYGRYEDGTANWFMMPDFTPGAPNVNTMDIYENMKPVTMGQNYPNPFESITNIEFSLSEKENVVISIYNTNGVLINVLADGVFQPGKHIVEWNAANLPPGYYFYKLSTNSTSVVNKALIIR
jgi:uncharacterized protein YggL (DUF469 family)